MKKNHNLLLAAAVCVAGLTACLLNEAKAESTLPTTILLNSATSAVQPAQSFGTFAPVAPVDIAFSGNSSVAAPVQPDFSITGLGINSVNHNSVPEPTSVACALLGLGALAGFRYLKAGRRA